MEQWQLLVLPSRRDLTAELSQPGMASNGPSTGKLGLTSGEGGGYVTQSADLLNVSRKQLIIRL